MCNTSAGTTCTTPKLNTWTDRVSNPTGKPCKGFLHTSAQPLKKRCFPSSNGIVITSLDRMRYYSGLGHLFFDILGAIPYRHSKSLFANGIRSARAYVRHVVGMVGVEPTVCYAHRFYRPIPRPLGHTHFVLYVLHSK